MTNLDDLPARLRSQMRAATATDIAPPDMLDRVHRAATQRRQRSTGAVAAVAVAAGLAVVALPGQGPSREPDQLAGQPPHGGQGAEPMPPGGALSVVRSDSGSLAVEVGGKEGDPRTERVQLPGYLRNNTAESVTVVAMTVPGTRLRADLPQPVELVPGGRLPFTLVRLLDCDAEPSLPGVLDLRVTAVGVNGQTSVLLPLPEEVVALYRSAHACSEERRAADDAEAEARSRTEDAQRRADETAGS